MAGWVVVPDLLSLRAEFDQLAPHRDKGADGTIGDQAHAGRSSDHNPDETGATPHEDSDTVNEVHALDVDASGPWPAGMDMAKAVAVVVATCKSLGDRSPLGYAIFNRTIREYPSWAPRPYDGTDPHTGHAHFSSRYGSGTGTSNPENFRGPWGLLEAFMNLSTDDKAWIKDAIDSALSAFFAAGDQGDPAHSITSKIGRDALNQGIPNPLSDDNGKDPAWKVLGDQSAALETLLERTAPPPAPGE